MKLRQLAVLLSVFTLPLAGCLQKPGASAQPAYTLNIFAASSLTEALEEIGEHFEMTHPGVTVVFNFAGSQQLAQQINEGAPADVFASANNKQMEMLIEAGSVVSGTEQTFAQNRLIVIYPKENPAGLRELKDLAKPGLQLVFAAEEVPAGQYSLEFLDKARLDPSLGSSYKEQVLNNVVSYEDNVKAVSAKVALGEADAGIVYLSDISGASADQVDRLEIPDELNVIASYPIAPIKGSENAELAQSFIDFVLSDEGQNVLAKYHFVPIK